ncbi:histidine phosphatase family protein [Alteromonas ponticola]|uniref:Histidine phosphatase family protein n=1 Tax=Alteromonas ponticola TaxID=2720613 RepID=A0ABX1R0K4_9ALTE|nr:histidine phosphatase family protein [Alteromonas ponticola]NMH59989.1 histidine phosphatase family protein [Alteromonas ponticola]
MITTNLFRNVLLLLLLSGAGNHAMAYDVYLTRHFEKQSQSADPELTAKGHWRAKQLINLLEDAEIARIYSTQYLRTQQSVAPIAKQLNLEVEIYPADNLQALADQIKTKQLNVLVVGHSNTIPPLISLLGGKSKAMAEEDFGELFKLQIVEGEVSSSSQLVGMDE